MDAGRQVDRVLVDAIVQSSDARAQMVHGSGRRRAVGRDADVSRLSGTHLTRWRAHRLQDEQLVGRGTPQLSRWPESSDLDLGYQNAGCRHGTAPQLQGDVSGLVRRPYGVLSLGSRR